MEHKQLRYEINADAYAHITSLLERRRIDFGPSIKGDTRQDVYMLHPGTVVMHMNGALEVRITANGMADLGLVERSLQEIIELAKVKHPSSIPSQLTLFDKNRNPIRFPSIPYHERI